jgi:hypothetical protein
MTEGRNFKLKLRTLAKESQESPRQRHQRSRTWESKEERQPPIYLQLRDLPAPQAISQWDKPRLTSCLRPPARISRKWPHCSMKSTDYAGWAIGWAVFGN